MRNWYLLFYDLGQIYRTKKKKLEHRSGKKKNAVILKRGNFKLQNLILYFKITTKLEMY